MNARTTPVILMLMYMFTNLVFFGAVLSQHRIFPGLMACILGQTVAGFLILFVVKVNTQK